MPDQGRHGIVTFSVHAQIGGLSITHQQPLALEETAHAVGDGMGQLREFGMGRRLSNIKCIVVQTFDNISIDLQT